MPDADLLALADRLCPRLLAVRSESGAFGLRGWAAATSASDLIVGKRAAALSQDALELFEHLMFAGNNGWADGPGKRDARRLLGQLAVTVPSPDADFIAGYVIGKGASSAAAKRLQAISSPGSLAEGNR